MNTTRAKKKAKKYYSQLRCEWCNVYQQVEYKEYVMTLLLSRSDGYVTTWNKQKDSSWSCQREKCKNSRPETA